MTRLGLLADVHANLPALDAVLAALAPDVDGWLCAGDLVGYGPFPDACVDRVVALAPSSTVAGNHDLIAAGRLSRDGISRLARQTLDWTDRTILESTRTALAALPIDLDVAGVALTHASPGAPTRGIRSPEEAVAALGTVDATILVVGHTHEPLAVSDRRGELLRGGDGVVSFAPGERLLVNPGAVGQSRSRDLRARAAVLDLDARSVRFVAVRYDVAACRSALRRAGLPTTTIRQPPARFPGGRRVGDAMRNLARR